MAPGRRREERQETTKALCAIMISRAFFRSGVKKYAPVTDKTSADGFKDDAYTHGERRKLVLFFLCVDPRKNGAHHN